MSCLFINSLIIMEEREFDHLKAQKKFWAQWSTVKKLKTFVLPNIYFDLQKGEK